MKVCIIYGSESGNSERAIRAIAKRWQGSNFEIGEVIEGATAAVRGISALAEQYDFLLVAKSSNGEGDPPFNFHPFLKALYAADDAGDKPLTGCGFAVLGFGCSHFDTFQNCPRIADKLMGELGGIRAVQREECEAARKSISRRWVTVIATCGVTCGDGVAWRWSLTARPSEHGRIVAVQPAHWSIYTG